MSIATDILDKISSGGFSRAFADPRPGASDTDIMKFYAGRYNQYATPESLRDIERGLKTYLDNIHTMQTDLSWLRDRALQKRGLRYDQTLKDIPEKSPTGRIMQELLNEDYLFVPKKQNHDDFWSY